MYFTLAVTGPSCDTVVAAALAADPAVMPVPGPPGVAWRSPDGRSALLTWPARADVTRSHAGTIFIGPNGAAESRTAITRVDPVYEVRADEMVVLSDRAFWAAAATGRLESPDPALIAQLLNVGYPLGGTTPFRGVRALPGAPAAPGTCSVADALLAAVGPLRRAGSDVELSLTGGKDSRLVAAALAAAGVPFRARTHGFSEHPDVAVAAQVAARLGVEHVVVTPAAPGSRADPLARIRAAVLAGDGMVSAFENIGRPDPERSQTISVGGHGGEILRGGYAEVVAAREAVPAGSGRAVPPPTSPGPLPFYPRLRRAAASAELLRRMTARRVRLLRGATASVYLASLAPWGAALRHGPLTALDDFYLVNRAGRWSAAARQAYLLREELVQPLFRDEVVREARSAPLSSRVSGEITRDAIAALRPDLLDVPFAGKAPAGTTFDWRRDFGTEVGGFFREYILSASPLFTVVSRPATERLLSGPHPDAGTVWALATMACLVTGDWRNARERSPRTYRVGPG